MELFGCAASPAWGMQPGRDLIYYSNRGEIMRKKHSLSSCWALEWWSVCLNELLTLHIKFHKPFYFERILLIPNIFSLWVLPWIFPVLGRFPANGLCSARLCFLLPPRGCVSLADWHHSQQWHWHKCPVSLGNALLEVLCWVLSVWRRLEDLAFSSNVHYGQKQALCPHGTSSRVRWPRHPPCPFSCSQSQVQPQYLWPTSSALSQPLIS